MREDIKKRWIEALRSGKYKQGKKRLKSLGGYYCCLGVLCDIVKDNLGIEWHESNESYVISGNAGVLPNDVEHYTGLLSTTLPSNPNRCLEGLNDLYGYTFEQIADVIEKEF
jgi:hypothetical protein